MYKTKRDKETEAMAKDILSNVSGLSKKNSVKKMTQKIIDNDPDKFRIIGAEILYKDFSSTNPYQPGPSFWVRIDGRKAKKMIREGWNVKTMTVKNKIRWFLPVSIYENDSPTKKINPHVYVQILDGKNEVHRMCNNYSFLDLATIRYAIVDITGYHWNINKPDKISGIKAFLKDGYFSVDKNINANEVMGHLSKLLLN